ncbi:hypothetical protein U9M48_011477 [Paspalum notatum var. saurae]|uniref:Fucosyltransferase n=1 Tax=Paspalum notatum var. saurae TaxID=547442 RepID=A0AAQ3SXG7_PASNO
MAMSVGASATGGRGVPDVKLEDPAEAPTEREKTRRCRQALLVGGLVTLPLVLFVVLGQESATTVWQIATAKLTAMNGRGFMNAAGHGHDHATGATKAHDELLGGLLAPGMDRRSCRSRYDSWRYYKHFPYAPSPHLLRRLRAYEARHRRCAPGTPLYAKAVDQLRSGRSAADLECNYVVWLPFDGLGNRMLSMVSGFLYALLTDRVFLAALPPDSDDLFCEPFPGATWRLPADDFLHVAKLFGVGQRPDRSYSSLLDKKEIAVPDDPAVNATAAPPVPPAYVYLSLGWLLTDRIFFCGEHQVAIKKVNWLLQYSDLYYAPSLYAVAEFQDELRRLFPAMESVSHLLARYLLHPSNSVWGLVTRYYRSYLAPADRRIGVQIRLNGMYDQILACSRQERVLPETDDGDELTGGGDGGNNNNGSTTATAILITSLYADYYDRLRSRYYEHAARVAVGVFQPTHEERQATDSLAHNRKALAEIYLLSFSDELLITGLSTFGYVAGSLAGVRPTILLTPADHNVAATPCRRAVSMEPCNLTPPRDVECRGEAVDKEDLARHVRVCEDWKNGVKFFD